MTVNVKTPDVVLNIEVRNRIYMYSKIIKTYGGLPYGSSGKGVSLLSGGIDSPVATWMMAKRGVEVEGVYFHSPPYTSEWAKQKVIDLDVYKRQAGAAEAAGLLPSGWCWKAWAAPAADRER